MARLHRRRYQFGAPTKRRVVLFQYLSEPPHVCKFSGPRLGSKTRSPRVSGALRLVLRTQPRSVLVAARPRCALSRCIAELYAAMRWETAARATDPTFCRI